MKWIRQRARGRIEASQEFVVEAGELGRAGFSRARRLAAGAKINVMLIVGFPGSEQRPLMDDLVSLLGRCALSVATVRRPVDACSSQREANGRIQPYGGRWSQIESVPQLIRFLQKAYQFSDWIGFERKLISDGEQLVTQRHFSTLQMGSAASVAL